MSLSTSSPMSLQMAAAASSSAASVGSLPTRQAATVLPMVGAASTPANGDAGRRHCATLYGDRCGSAHDGVPGCRV